VVKIKSDRVSESARPYHIVWLRCKAVISPSDRVLGHMELNWRTVADLGGQWD
jgi:hypothetical protein